MMQRVSTFLLSIDTDRDGAGVVTCHPRPDPPQSASQSSCWGKFVAPICRNSAFLEYTMSGGLRKQGKISRASAQPLSI